MPIRFSCLWNNWRRTVALHRTFSFALVLAFGTALAAEAEQGEPAEASAEGPFADAVDYAQKRTVKIFGAGIGRSPGYGTGVIVSADGDVLTANGVYLAGDRLRVTLPDGETHAAVVTRRSNELQTALLKIDAMTPDFFELAKTPVAQQGDWILAVSNAFKVAEGPEPLSVNIGVLGLRMKLDARRGFQDFPYEAEVYLYDAITSNPGAAGGAVIAADGRLVGMIGIVIEARSTNTRLNYAVPADLLSAFVRGEVTRPMTAVRPASQADLGIRLFSLGGRKSPAYIDRVQSGGPAASAGLKTDDLIVTIAGQTVRDVGEYQRVLETLEVGKEVVMEVKRKNELLSVRIVPVADK